ncbi:AraC family transcriptional regulator [Mycolicibacterium stellerae]|uniref:AraC family transcriptional regulator n=1 Tax=Mycolicibacterium stellerae TaxID=2358193 RepID=UPI000F0B8E82|nr:AraC family transcriptional regulator [Mycolicibacterium stellerae]
MTVPSAVLRRPVVAARVLCAVAAEVGVSVSDVLAGTSVTPADLEAPDGAVSSADEITMARTLLRLAPKPAGIGVAVGSRINLTNLGMFGFAAMSSGTLRELISVGLRFFSLTTLHSSIVLSERQSECEITVDAGHLPADVRRFFMERDIAAIMATVPGFVHPVLARHADEICVELAAAEEYLRPLLDAVAIRDIEFDRDRTVVRVPRGMLDEPLPQADPHTLAVCVAECERILERRRRHLGLSARVRSELLSSPGEMPGIDAAAASLHLHPRTLRRRLAEEGTSFRAITNDVRASLATELLSQVGLTVEQVARRLGYAETAAFNHAFSRWFGLAPSEYRRTHSI